MSDDKKLKPCPQSYQAISNAMMALHGATEAVADAAHNVAVAVEQATPELQRDGLLIAEIHAKAYLPLAKLAMVQHESRAMHYPLSEVLKTLGYELPVVLTRSGPGGGGGR